MRRAAVVTMAAWALAGCTSLGAGLASFDLTPDGVMRGDAELRAALDAGDAARARRLLDRRASPALHDQLLRDLYAGTVALRTGDAAGATARFEAAHRTIERRFTQSVSQHVGAATLSDWLLPYTLGRAERAMLPVYAGLAWSARGAPDAAAVEARRLAALLTHADQRDRPLPDDLTRVLRRVSGALFEQAGDGEDAAVAYRLAGGDTARLDPRSDSGEVVLVVERGHAGDRVARSLAVALLDGEFAAIAAGGDDGLRVATRAAERALWPGWCGWDGLGCPAGRWGPRAGRDLSLLTVSWAEYRRGGRLLADEGGGAGDLAIFVGGTAARRLAGADLAAALAADVAHEAPVRLARAVLRAALREASWRASRRTLADDDAKDWEKAIAVAGAVYAASGVITERADTRSWAFLPATLEVHRVRVPPGRYTVRVGGVHGTAAGWVTVRGGRVAVAHLRAPASRSAVLATAQ